MENSREEGLVMAFNASSERWGSREALRAFITPGSVAVIGASRTPGSVGHEVVRNLLRCGFSGKVFPINPKADELLGLRCYPSILKVDGDVDLAVVAVPAQIVPKVVEEAGEKGVKALIVISAGFREVGSEGYARERGLVEACRRYGVRLLGPNCLGLMNTYTPLNVTFASQMPSRGGLAFISQSGALITAVLDWALMEGFGFSNVVSLGNKADVDEADFISLLADDVNTKAILIYLEGVEDGRRFLKIAAEASAKKPIAILKSGVSEAGAKAISSHTGSMAGSSIAYSTAFKKSGVAQANSIEELLNLGLAFSSQPLSEGRGVAIVTNAGGPGIIAADACAKHNLNLAWLSLKTIGELRKRLPPEASWINPIDVLGDSKADRYSLALETALEDRSVDAAIVILTPQAMTQPFETANEIIAIKDRFPKKPLLASFMGGVGVRRGVEALMKAGIPNYLNPEDAVAALAKMADYSEYLRRGFKAEAPSFKVCLEEVKDIISRARREGRVNLLSVEAEEVARAYGIQTPQSGLAQNFRQAIQIARGLGYPVALKIVSPQILHKTDVGGVKLNLASDEEVSRAFNEVMREASILMPEARVYGVEVQKMAPAGKEMIIGMHRDLQFGPLIMFGLGGVYANLIKDVSFKLAPLSKEDAYEMIAETKAYKLLRGVRGEARSDIGSVAEAILRVSQIAMDFKEINDIDINPLIVYREGGGSLALDIKIIVA